MLKLVPIVWTLLTALPSAARAADWVYFDLGEVVLSGTPATGYSYVPGALSQLEALRAAGYQLGLITNTPEAWGATCQSKFSFLQSFVASGLKSPPLFPWAHFTYVIQAPFDRYRKPEPYMFLNGLAKACPDRALYISTKAAELTAAKALGYATWLKAPQQPFPSVEATGELLDGFSFAYPDDCNLEAQIAASVLARDQGTTVAGCIAQP